MRVYKIIISLILLTIVSCAKEPVNCYLNLCIDWEEYSAQAVLNDSIDWRAQHVWFAELNNGKTIIDMNFSNEYGELRESIRISDFDLSIGTKILLPSWGVWTPDFEEPSAYFDTLQADGDAATENYDLYKKDNFENYLKINSISADGSEIEGEYQLYFVISPNSPSKFDKNRPDTLIFTDGFFKARHLD